MKDTKDTKDTKDFKDTKDHGRAALGPWCPWCPSLLLPFLETGPGHALSQAAFFDEGFLQMAKPAGKQVGGRASAKIWERFGLDFRPADDGDSEGRRRPWVSVFSVR